MVTDRKIYIIRNRKEIMRSNLYDDEGNILYSSHRKVADYLIATLTCVETWKEFVNNPNEESASNLLRGIHEVRYIPLTIRDKTCNFFSEGFLDDLEKKCEEAIE
ncbi:hypothetical protein KAT36_02700 [Candidatus Pacearchaeota archaeon]|nr:hypothetical protein [Candidatus Pacearchaeota archaeon]